MPSTHLPIRPESAGRALPERLRRSLETLSGYDLSDVRVHADSVLPEQVGARAFAHGSDIYLEPGAEETLAHEAWHVVQQKQGRVRATRELGSAAQGLGGTGLNDDGELEAEAEVMGRLALLLSLANIELPHREGLRFTPVEQPSVQRYVRVGGNQYDDLTALRTAITNTLELSNDNVEGFLRIVIDLLNENLTFATWELLGREIQIRAVGYQAEAEMRKLMVVMQRNRAAAMEGARAITEEGNTLYADQLSLPEHERTYADSGALKLAIDEKKSQLYLDKKVIRWTNPTLFGAELDPIKDYPIFRWLTGEIPNPLQMNCWEAVVYALVQTGLVPRDYMTWCIRTRKGTLPELQLMSSIRMLAWAVKNRDYSFVSPAAANDYPDMARTQPQTSEKAPRGSIFIPSTLVIPRGRLLFFGANCEHVAISTGRFMDLSDSAREQFGMKRGHGMLELDGNSGTIREWAIEELWACKKLYLLKVLTVAPFPVITTEGVVELRAPSKNPQKAKEAKTKRGNIRAEHRRSILADMETKEQARKKEMGPHLEQRNLLQAKKLQQGLSANELSALDEQIATLQKEIDDIKAKSEQEQKDLAKTLADAEVTAQQEYVKWVENNPQSFETKKLSYGARDPYKGLVNFPYRID